MNSNTDTVTIERERDHDAAPDTLFEKSKMDWPIKAGLIGSGVWILLLATYISGALGWANIADVSIDILGSFLEGAFAPLAFLWFVLGYFSQQKELSLNTKAISLQHIEMQKSAIQAVIQAEAIQASELHARRESFLSVAESVKAQLGAIMGFLFISSQGSNPSGQVPPEKMSELWHAMGSSDHEIFSRHMLSLTYTHGEIYSYKLMFGTELRRRHSEDFIFNFERLIQAAIDCDTNGMIRDAIGGSAHGHIYDRILEIRNSPPKGYSLDNYDFDPDSMDD
ncbi:MAG: hypothetical protein JKY88_19140 [Pseudomonadales bacterium]|nr:hypothetical protein [Pseudomonadales bacterium]